MLTHRRNKVRGASKVQLHMHVCVNQHEQGIRGVSFLTNIYLSLCPFKKQLSQTLTPVAVPTPVPTMASRTAAVLLLALLGCASFSHAQPVCKTYKKLLTSSQPRLLMDTILVPDSAPVQSVSVSTMSVAYPMIGNLQVCSTAASKGVLQKAVSRLARAVPVETSGAAALICLLWHTEADADEKDNSRCLDQCHANRWQMCTCVCF